MKKFTFLFLAIILAAANLFAADLTVTGSFPSNIWNNANPDYKMTEIGTTGVYMLEKTLPAGSYEFKVFYSGTWNGATTGDNRVIVLTAEKTVKFYAKDNGGTNPTISFFSDAQELYVIGATVGGWDAASMKLMTNTSADATYTADVVAGNYKIVVKDKNNAIVWNDITPADQTVGGTGNFTIKLDFATFAVSATANSPVIPSLSSLSNSFITVGADMTTAAWYNASGTGQTESFNSKDLGSITSTLYLGGEITTAPVLDGVTVKMFAQIDELAATEIPLVWISNDGTTSSKWQTTAGTDILAGKTLTEGTVYNVKVWFNATDGTATLWDSNNSANYVATFTYGEAVTGPTWCGDSYITVGGKTTGTWYKASATVGESASFQGANLGTYDKKTTTSVTLGGELQVYPKTTDNVTMYFGTDGVEFSPVTLTYVEDAGNNSKHYGEAQGDISTLAPGEYSLYVYFQAGNVYDSNNAANYVATFTVVDTSTAVDKTESGFSILSANGKITALFEGLADIKLFSVSGQLISSKVVSNEFTQEVSRGVYILRINGTAHKVLVK